MKSNQFKDFGELYRAAYAEADQQKKSLLLREVCKAIEERIQEPTEAPPTRVEAA
jgi:hypothetical protein